MHRHKKKNFLYIKTKRMIKSSYGRREEKGESMGSAWISKTPFGTHKIWGKLP